jgi:hypothetical protein
VVARETLPHPVVHYPGSGGTFFAFAAYEDETPALCACARPAVEHLLRAKREVDGGYTGGALVPFAAYQSTFPVAISLLARERDGDPMAWLPFAPRLCHRCNVVTPGLRYRQDAGLFRNAHGWYIEQAWLRLGVTPLLVPASEGLRAYVLRDVCPPDLLALLDDVTEKRAVVGREWARVCALVYGPRRTDIPADEVVYMTNVRQADAAPYIAATQAAAKPALAESHYVENLVRAEFGFRKVGERWVGETMLAQLVARLFPGEPVVRHDRPEWLGGLELDIHLPGHALAFEYQGQQHFHPIKAWGGAKALAALQARDARKAALCRERGVRLVAVDYTEPLTEAHVAARLEGGSPPHGLGAA